MSSVGALSKICDHKFVQRALLRAVDVQKALGDRAPTKIEAEYSRDPGEHEFFLLGVGHCTAELLTCCEHLEHIPLYVSNYHETPSMKKAGINRHKHIVYQIEGYLVRAQSLFDRMLKLVDAVFHLLNAPQNCRSTIILKNLKVKRTRVPIELKRLEKLLGRYATSRNEVVHHHSFKDDRLRVLEMYHIIQDIEPSNPAARRRDYSEIRKERTEEIVRKKKREFLEFNEQLAQAIIAVLDALEPHYKREERGLRVRLGKPAA